MRCDKKQSYFDSFLLNKFGVLKIILKTINEKQSRISDSLILIILIQRITIFVMLKETARLKLINKKFFQ